MNMRSLNLKRLVLLFATVLLVAGVQGLSYAQTLTALVATTVDRNKLECQQDHADTDRRGLRQPV